MLLQNIIEKIWEGWGVKKKKKHLKHIAEITFIWSMCPHVAYGNLKWGVWK